MSLKIAVVGRPNVGKSALFNRICRHRVAIVDAAEGVTRDRLYADAEFFSRPFTLIDTGGIDSRSTAAFNFQIKAQAELAIEEADGLILVVDSEVGVTDLDLELARMLQQTNKPLVVAVNKVDGREHQDRINNFYSLGIADMVPISAIHGHLIVELLAALMDKIPEEKQPQVADSEASIALLGRPNVGKSTLLNTLLQEERTIVSPLAGTTRDSIDMMIQHADQQLTLIDTAGIRRKKSERFVVDKFAAIRTEEAIKRADVCVLLCDAREGLTSFEKRIIASIEAAGKGCLLFFNKWDLVKGFRMEHLAREVRTANPFLSHCPLLFASAKTGRNVDQLLDLALEIARAGRQTIPTGKLNKFLIDAMQRLHPPVITGKRLRIYYMTQVGHFPLKFRLFVNASRLMAQSYQRYLHNQLRENFDLRGIPIAFEMKGKK